MSRTLALPAGAGRWIALGGALLLVAAPPVEGQSEERVYTGFVQCHSTGPGRTWVPVPNAMVVPDQDSSAVAVTDLRGVFRFTLSVPEGPEDTGQLYIMVGDSLSSDPRARIRVGRDEILFQRRGRLDRSWQARSPVRMDSVAMPCDSLNTRRRPTTAEIEGALRYWRDRDSLRFRQVETATTGEPALVEAGTGIGKTIAGVGRALWRGARVFFGGAVDAPLLSGFAGSCAPCADSIGFRVDTGAVVARAGPRVSSIAFGAVAENPGFAFAPSLDLRDAPMWNASSMLLAEGITLGFSADGDRTGYLRGSAMVPLSDGVVVGAIYASSDTDRLRFCELDEAVGCPSEDEDDLLLERNRMESLAYVCYTFPVVSDLGGGIRDTLSLVYDCPGAREPADLGSLSDHFELDERVIGLSVATRLGPRLGAGLTLKQIRRRAEVPIGVERLVKLSFFGDSGSPLGYAACRDQAGPTDTDCLDPDSGFETYPRLLRETVTETRYDVDVSGIFVTDAFELGVSLMNLGGSTVADRDGTRLNTRSLGLGAAYTLGRLHLGTDALFFAEGDPAFGAGVAIEPLDRLFLRGGYATEYSTWTAGIAYRGAMLSYLSSPDFGTRLVSGFQLDF